MRLPLNVKRGAEMLDARLPGWRSRVDTERLDLGHSCNCVLGQVFGTYDEGEELLGLTQVQSERYGFLAYGRQSYDTLTAAWKRLLA